VHPFARAHGMSDSALRSLVQDFEARVLEVDGRAFRSYAATSEPALAVALGLGAQDLLCGNETSHVSGSHKARHLMGIMLFLLAREKLGLERERAPLAIASCGNAGLAAATLAAAAKWPLEVFVPAQVDPIVAAQLETLGAKLTRCERRQGERGDPSYLRFREAIASGAIPFSCQGPDNGITLEGGETLGLELAERCAELGQGLDHVFVQVGGGALFAGIALGMDRAVEAGWLAKLPRLHAVQTRGAFPLPLAWERLSVELGATVGGGVQALADEDFSDAQAKAREARALRLQAALGGEGELENAGSVVEEEGGRALSLQSALGRARGERSRYMSPWPAEPKSVAHGILDDETYDWVICLRAMLVSGGTPVVVEERDLEAALRLTRTHT